MARKKTSTICSICGRNAKTARVLTLMTSEDEVLDFVFFCASCWASARAKIETVTSLADPE